MNASSGPQGTAGITDAAADVPAQVARHQAALRQDGYTVFSGLITPAQVAEMRQAIDRHVERPPEAHVNNDRYSGANLVAWHPAFAAAATHPLLLATIAGLLGDDFILSSANLAARRPGCNAQGLHRDTGIWGPSLPFMPFAVGIQTVWCVDDFTPDNGATLVVPGSHVDPAGPADTPRQAVEITVPAGSVIAFDAQALHAGGANRSSVLRRGVLTLYIRSWLKPQTDFRRSWSPAELAVTTPEMRRLLGLQRQTPIELPDGTQRFIAAPDATNFYGGPLQGTTGY